MSTGSEGAASRGGLSRLALLVAQAVFFVAICAVLFEICCQAYAWWVVFPRFDSRRASPRHFFRASESPILGYEVRPGAEVVHDGKRLRINRYGIRDDEDDLAADKRKVAVLGDSVAFGASHSQEKTIPALLQQELDPAGQRIKVLNFAVGGYALAQLLEQLKAKDEIYDVDDVVYLLNFNDFARHESIYEGADNGLYRTYVRPRIMSLFFVRKAIYRWMKGGPNGSEAWYRWLYEGNEERGQAILAEMARYAEAEDIRFGVVLLPSGLSYTDDGYALQDLHDRLGAFLGERGIRFISPVEAIGRDRESYFDPTDHFHGPGNREMARLIAEFVRAGDREGG